MQREATLQAADLYDKAGNTAKSRVMLEAFVKHFPQPLNPAMEARNKLSLIAAKAGDYQRRATIGCRDIIAADRAAGAARTDRSRALAAKATLDARDAGARGVQEHQAGGAAEEIAGREAQGDGSGAQGL